MYIHYTWISIRTLIIFSSSNNKTSRNSSFHFNRHSLIKKSNFTWDCLGKTLTRFCSKCCRSTQLLCHLLRAPWSRCDTVGTRGVCNACTSHRCCKIYRMARRIARICVLDGIARRRCWRTPWVAPFFSGTADQPSASCEHKAGCRRSRSTFERDLSRRAWLEARLKYY